MSEQEKQKCPECGSTEFAVGFLGGGAQVRSLKWITNFFIGSDLHLTFCKQCGLVQSLRVVHPERFKS
jgi:hypothetical protein